MLESLLQYPADSTTIITIVSGRVAAAEIGASSSVFNDFVLSRCLCGSLLVAARRRGAARRLPRRRRRCSRVEAVIWRLGRLAAVAGASSAAVCASPAAAVGRARLWQKSAEFVASFLVLYVGWCVHHVCF